MAAYLSVTVAQFTALYCRVVGGMEGGGANLSLKEKSNGDCIMWSSGGCGVYQVRPLQCRTYPFWQSMLVSREIWEAATADCPGAGSGEMRSAGYINKCRKIMEDKNEA